MKNVLGLGLGLGLGLTLGLSASVSAQFLEPSNWVKNPMPLIEQVDTQLVCRSVLTHNTYKKPIEMRLQQGKQKPSVEVFGDKYSEITSLDMTAIFQIKGYAPKGIMPFISHKLCGEFWEEYNAADYVLYNDHKMPSGLNLEFKSLTLECKGDVQIITWGK